MEPRSLPGMTMKKLFLSIFRRSLIIVAGMISRFLLQITVVGVENIPKDKPLILISNHFSWFDAPLLTLLLPIQPIFLVATESQKRWFVRLFINLFNGIPIWRGQVDRKALGKALNVLSHGGVLGIFPEGGIDPNLAEVVSQGEMVTNIYDHASRHCAQLVRPRSGVALLAVESQAHILPIGLIGTEQILDNLLSLRRTRVTLRIGPAFGPFTLDPKLQGRAKRQRLDTLADFIMQQVAILFPPENRGPYRHVRLNMK